MVRDIMATIQTKSAAMTSERMTVETWTASETLVQAGKQPLDGETAKKEYGLEDAGGMTLFFTKPTESIHVKRQDGDPQRIKYGTQTFEIVGVYAWPTHYEIIGKPVI